MAEAALELLLSNLRARRTGGGPSGAAEKVLQHELIVRESSAPPRVEGAARIAPPARLRASRVRA